MSCIRDEVGTNIYGQGWKTIQQLGLLYAHDRKWTLYVEALRGAHILLGEVEDMLVWERPCMWVMQPFVWIIIIVP